MQKAKVLCIVVSLKIYKASRDCHMAERKRVHVLTKFEHF